MMHILRFSLGTLIITFCVPALARPELPKDLIATLEKGKILEFSNKKPGTDIKIGKAIGLFNDTPEAMAYALLDVKSYKFFIDRVKDSRITKQNRLHTFAVVHTDLPWPVKDCWVYAKFTRYNKPGRIIEIKWWKLNGTAKEYTGTALIEPWNKDATKSVLTYELLFEPETRAPDSMISDGVRSVVTHMVIRLINRLQALRKFNKMPKVL
jgi:hypothetical protein